MTLQRVIEMTNPVDQVAVDIAALLNKSVTESEGIKPTSFTRILENDEGKEQLVYSALVNYLLANEYNDCPVELAMNFESGLAVCELMGYLRATDPQLAEVVRLECLTYENVMLSVLVDVCFDPV